MCRRQLPNIPERREEQPNGLVQVPIPNDALNYEEITNNVMAMSRTEVIERLRNLLESPDLETQLQQVRRRYIILFKKQRETF